MTVAASATASADPGAGRDLAALARRIGIEVAGVWADDVDRDARFPSETMTALRDARLLGALIPPEFGGLGADLAEIAAVTTELARHCASSAMIFAMHQIQIACLVEHGRTPALRAFLRRVAFEQLLVASATTEIGIGGDVRSSSCAVERGPVGPGDPGPAQFRLQKQAPVISYGQHADAILATARRDPDSSPSDQSLVLCLAPTLELDVRSGWDTLGFRGTCSLGFLLTATGNVEQVFDDPYGEISARTMLPVSHLLWSSLWLGIASCAADKARRFVQVEARRHPGTMPPGALRLAELNIELQQFAESTLGLLRRYLEPADGDAMSMSMALALNTLKVSASTLVVDIVGRAMVICGIAGYQQDSVYSLGRLLRDAHGAAVMVNNDRILHNNAQLLLAVKEL